MLWEKNSLIQAGKAEERRSPRNSHDKVIWSLTWSASTWLLVNWVSGSYLWQYLTSDPEIVSVASKDDLKTQMCASRSQLPPRSLGPAPSPCLTHNDHFLFPQPKVKVQIQFVVLHICEFPLRRKCWRPVWNLLMCACPTIGLQHQVWNDHKLVRAIAFLHLFVSNLLLRCQICW